MDESEERRTTDDGRPTTDDRRRTSTDNQQVTTDHQPLTADSSTTLRAGEQQARNDGLQRSNGRAATAEQTTGRPSPSTDLGSEADQRPVIERQVTSFSFTNLDDANAEIARLRRENASRRTSNRELEQQIGDLQQKQAGGEDVVAQLEELQTQVQRLTAAGEAGISPELFAASNELQSAKTADEIRSATDHLQRVLAPQNGNGGRIAYAQTGLAGNPAPPRQPSAPPTEAEQMSAAMRDGNMREVERLNAEKLADLGGT